LKKPSGRNRPPAAILAVILLSQVHPVFAREAPPDSLVRERIAAIRQALERGKPGAGRWWTGWLIGYGAATVGQGIVCATSKDKRTRQDMALGAATTGLGVIGQLLTPMIPAEAPGRLASFPETNPEERLNKLSAAETLLKECASREEEGRSWKTHAVTGIVNLGSGLVAWLGFKRCAGDGIANFALNTLVTEAQIWTQPTRAVRDYGDYVRRHPSAAKTDARPDRWTWSVHAVPGGIGITVQM
jgi:hypothetical protein